MTSSDAFPLRGQGWEAMPVGGSMEAAAAQRLDLTIFTTTLVIRGSMATRHRRLSDVFNKADGDFITLGNVVVEEVGQRTQPDRGEFAQVNLDTILFAVTDSIVEPQPELQLVKSAEEALIVLPPFKVVGRVHVLPDRDMRQALAELSGRFVPMTDATFWSESLREPKTSASFVAFNRARAQVLASHHEVDPWQGLARP